MPENKALPSETCGLTAINLDDSFRINSPDIYGVGVISSLSKLSG